MGIFNNINEKTNKVFKHIKRPPLFLTSSTEDTVDELFRWIVGNSSSVLIQNGNKLTIKQNCTLIILVDAIKINKGKVELQLKNSDSKLLQSYKAENNRRNESISIHYADQFKMDDVIYIDGLNVKNIQLTIFGV